MKTKIKRHSRAVLSIVLTVCMLVSCMTVGMIATDAAKTAEERVGAVDGNEAVGAVDGNEAVGADVGTSDYVYHGVNTSGQAVSGYESKTMSEGVIGGQKYAYYNVTGRESVGYDQLFYISKGGSYDGRYVYFTDKGSTYTDWANHDPTAYFYNSSGVAVGDAWPGKAMTWVSGSGSNVDKNWKLEIPEGATGVTFTNGKSDGAFKQTHDINLTNTNGSYYPSGYSNNKYEVTQWTTPNADSGIIAGTDYYWDTDVYKDQWYTGGFSNHNVNDVNNFAKPKDSNGQTFSDSNSDYYIVVLYPNTSYTFNLPGHNAETKTVGFKPMVLWMPQLPGQEETVSSYVKVYAKDGTIRRQNNNYSNHNRNDKDYSTFEKHANTFVYSDSGYTTHIGTRSSNDGKTNEGSGYDGFTYDYIAKFEKGQTLYIKTYLKNDTYMNRYYLYAYSINGKCYQIHTVAESRTGSVTEAFTVPEDWEDKYVEITPIYFLRDSSDEITFYVEGYDEEVMNAGWGNTPYVYPFYQDANFNYVGNVNNAFGGYQGQPLVFYKGNYYTQLPKIFKAIPESGGTPTNCTIRGVTLGNGYWDDIHYLTKEVKSHFQTYDYDDLYKIVTEYPTEADHIICSFKYRTKKNNDELGNPNFSNYNKTNGNGWEVLTDYYGRPVDVFGKVLDGDALTLANSIIANPALADSSSTAVVHAISQDYKSNSAGSYGTEWAIYNTAGTKVVATSGGKTTIVPSALAIKATTTGTDVAAGLDKYGSETKSFKSIYTALYNDSAVRGQPVVITYEKSIYGGGEKADRCDARWYFSTTGQPISATTRIEYTDDGRTWNTDTYNVNTGTGSHTGTKAYFTGKASTAKDTPDPGSTISGKDTTTISGTTGGGYYTFNAENHNGTNGNYEFVGWYLLRDNYQNISVRSSYASDATQFPSHAEQSKNGDVFVARFKKTATGTFDIYHEVHPQASGYGHVYVEAVVQDAGGTQQGSKIGSISDGTLTSHITIPNTYIKSGEGYKVIATFKAAPYPTSNFDNFYATVNELLSEYDGYGFVDSVTFDTTNNTATVTYDVNSMFTISGDSPVQTVSNVTHYSKFSLKTNLTYSLQYKFKTRYYGYKLYKYDDVAFTEQELRSYFLDQITDPVSDHIKLNKQFVKAKAPFESNFREDLTWVVDDVTFNNNDDPTIGYLTAYQVDKKTVDGVVYDSEISGGQYAEVTKRMTTGYMKLFSINANATNETAEAFDPSDGDLYRPNRTTYLDNGVEKPVYIDHWNMYQLDTFSYDGFDAIGNLNVSDKAVLVAQSYSSKMNYVGFEDYAIVPVYSTELVNRQEISDNRTDASATLLSITRNHWNTTISGNADSGSYNQPNTNYDRLYVDFMLNYNYSTTVDGKKQNIMLSKTDENIKVGFVVRSYTVVNGEKVYRTGKSQTVLIDKSKIDDKNRLEYCYGFNNTQNNSQWGLNFEFTPFIVDTSVQTTESAATINIDGTDYQTLYPATDFKCLDGVTFYMIGKADTDWA